MFGKCSTRSKKYASRLLLSGSGWQSEHSTSFLTVIDSIKLAVILAYPSEDLVPCLFTDASKNFWMIAITQVPLQDLHLVFKEQAHQPLAFCSGAFKNSSVNWSVPEKKPIPFNMLFVVLTIYYAPGNICFGSLQITET